MVGRGDTVPPGSAGGGRSESQGTSAESVWARRIPAAELRKITEYSPDVILVLDLEYRIQFVNWTLEGISPERVIGTEIFAFVSADQHAEMRTCFERVLATGQPGSFPSLLLAPSGQPIEWESRVGPMVEDGKAMGLAVFARDVTERNKQVRELDRFFELSVDLFCVTDQAGRFRRVSASFSSVLGHPRQKLLGESLSAFAHPDDRARVESSLSRMLESGAVIQFETRFRHESGAYHLLAWNVRPDVEGGLVFGAARDITLERNLERQLRESQKMEAVGQLAGGLAHDFNNLMMAVLANVEFATEESRDRPEVSDYLSQIAEAATKAAALTKQLLSFSRRDAIRRSALDVNELIGGLVSLLRRLIPASIEIDVVAGAMLPKINADPNQLEQVLMNLCINARDAMPHGGRLRIETECELIDDRFRHSHPWARTGSYGLIRVADSGVGMTKDVSDRIFEPFFSTKVPGLGTGLGLSTVYAIIKQHAGIVHVHSEAGRGTTFEVYIPVAAQLGDGRDSGRRAGLSPDETILIAEDEDLVRNVVIQILERGGYRVLSARNGREAVELLRQNLKGVALALLDVVMPELSGPEAFVFLRELRPDLPVIFSSGYTDQARFAHSLPQGSVLIEKPYRAEALLRNVREALAARSLPPR